MSNFKNTVYSILNEDAGDTDQEIRRKANTAALMNKGLKGDELLVAMKEYDASTKRSDAEVSAAADNRGREEAVGMVASGEATSMGDARNRMGVRDQVAAERARMAKNPVREVGIASPSSQIGGAGTQYGNSPNLAPETPYDPEKEKQSMTDLHNSESWKKMDAARKDPDTIKAMKTSKDKSDKENAARNTPEAKAARAAEKADREAKRQGNQNGQDGGNNNKNQPGGSGGGGLGNNGYGESKSPKSDPNNGGPGSGSGGNALNSGGTAPRLGGTAPGGNPTAQDSQIASTVTSSTSSIVSARTAPRVGQASVLASFNANKNKRGLRSRAMQTAGYSHNKALTFFAEQLKRKYIEEEVVNSENQPMTKSEISHRDKIKHKDPAKNARVVKGPRGRLDTSEEAKYRLATYITMRGRKGKKKENK